MSEPWPKLSETLRFERSPLSCQSCGHSAQEGTKLERHQECDDKDQPTLVLVILCDRCAKQLIEKHPRLYQRIDINKPWPGAMALCDGCKFRKDLSCQHPDLKQNGGNGLYIKFAEPMRGFWDGSDPKTGRRTGGMFERYPAPPSECRGRTL